MHDTAGISGPQLPASRAGSASSGSPTFSIIATSLLISICYLTIGLQLAVVPPFVHLRLGYTPLLAGLAISAQYVATLLSRPLAGRSADTIGPKRTASWGLLVCAASGAGFALAAFLQRSPSVSLVLLLTSRLFLGFGESWVATGATVWGIGRTGAAHTTQAISWAGIASYGALAVGAPLGLWLENTFGTASIGVVSVVAALIGFCLALKIGGVAVLPGEEQPFLRVLRTVLPYGLGLTCAGIGFGTIASFITLYYASRNWPGAGRDLSLFGAAFVAVRLLFSGTINRWGGFRTALVSLAVEFAGLLLLSLGAVPFAAEAGAALSGAGFSLVFPALGVEAIRKVPERSRGSALGVYTAFIDLSLGISGPIAGVIIGRLGYPPAFLFAVVMAAVSAAFTVTAWWKQAAAKSRTIPASETGQATGDLPPTMPRNPEIVP
jgi:MFS family permease